MSAQSLKQAIELKQTLRLNPQQVLLGRYLEMSAPELEEEISRVLDDNPALIVADEDRNIADDSNRDTSLRVTSYYRDSGSTTSRGEFFEPASPMVGETLLEAVMSQVDDLGLDSRQREIASFVVGNLDTDGYLRRGAAALADDLTAMYGEEFFADEVSRVVDIIKTLEPHGIAAQSLKECLEIQLKTKKNPDRIDLLALKVVRDCFDALSKKHYETLQNRLAVDRETLKDVLDRIRSLDPRPGLKYDSHEADEHSAQIYPDFYVAPADGQGGRFDIILLNMPPGLRIEESFKVDGDNKQDKTPADAFIKRKADEAMDFIKLLEARSRTMLAVMKAIVSLQSEFFVTENPVDIRPMVLKDVAALTGFSLSMISRATAGKYVATPAGVYPVKMFFNEKPKDNDDNLTREVISSAIREAVEQENKSKPLNDDALTRLLNEKGLDIARRTVAKHREKLGIPVARLRKKI